MKKLILILSLISTILLAHKQHVHQYITIEAYNLLKMHIGFDITAMKSKLGTMESFYAGDHQFQRGFITSGAWREDEEDIVYGYSKTTTPTLTGWAGIGYDFITIFGGLTPDPFVSCTHFWYADNGDALKTDVRATVYGGGTHIMSFTVPNAYQKFKLYRDGNWAVQVNEQWLFKVDGHDAYLSDPLGQQIRFFGYDTLSNFYKTGIVKIKNLAAGRYFIHKKDGSVVKCVISSNEEPICLRLKDDVKNKVVWEILGRMCHLLQDMSVPAHANVDPHGSNDGLIPDYYEKYFGYDFYWNGQNVYSEIGSMIDPYYFQPNDPLHFLMYTTNQMANHFATEGPDKKSNNDVFEGDGTPEEIAYLTSLNISQFGEPTSDWGPFGESEARNVRNKMLPQAIRSTAGLLYWFANQCNLINPPPPPPATVVPVIANFNQSPLPIFLGESGTVVCNLDQGDGTLNYTWQLTRTKPGIILRTYENEAYISYYASNTLLTHKNKYDFFEPVGVEIECTVSNSLGYDTKKFVVQIARRTHGCPFIYSWNGETWIEDNNILPQSQDIQNLGNDVSDYYKLYIPPKIDNSDSVSRYYLAVGEFESEKSYLDKLSLKIVDHPKDTYITVDNAGDITLISKPADLSEAQLDSIDVYKQLYQLDSNRTSFSAGDTLRLLFSNINNGYSRWLLINGQANENDKDRITGNVITGKMRVGGLELRLRKNPSEQWIFIPDTKKADAGEEIEVALNSEGSIDYTASSQATVLPYQEYYPALINANHTVFGDVTEMVSNEDNNYVILNKDEMIVMEFTVPEIDESKQRTFIFCSRGRYEKLPDSNSTKKNPNKLFMTNAENSLSNNFTYSLSYNYPNPFNPSTEIKYSIKEKGLVTMKIYDILGNVVKTLIEENKEAGNYSVTFNASNFSSGIYFYELIVGNGLKPFRTTKKMVYLK